MFSDQVKSITRRNFLRGLGGAAMSLPCLEAMAADQANPPKPNQRMAFFYVPIGVVRRSFFPGETDSQLLETFKGNTLDLQLGKQSKKDQVSDLDQLTPTMQPLENIKNKISLITGLDRTFQNGTDVHAQCASCFLSSAAPFSIKSSAWPLDRTLDQIVADKIGNNTPFRSLEISCNSHKDNRESIYFDNISWYGTGHVAPSIRDPRVVYQRLFGTKESKDFRNITDLVLADAKTLQRELGYADKIKFEEYFDSVRTIELQINRLELMKGELTKLNLEEPPEAHLPRGEYIRLMGDLMVAALQTGLTNVATMMIGPERWDTPFMYESLFDKPKSHHSMSHNQKKWVKELEQIDHFHMQQFAYLIEKMEKIQESDGTSLLDNTIFTYGSGLGDGATHQYNDLPIIIAGSGGGKLNTGKHIQATDGTPLANLWLMQAQVMGIKLERFAESTQAFTQILA